jgi:ADP-heptose:LPS heptosyltransferase
VTHALRGRYLVRRLPVYAYLTALDWALQLRPSTRGRAPRAEIRSIIIAIGGSAGDAVIATSIIDSIARSRPELKVSVLAPSWSCNLIAGHPAVTRVHTLDHWHTSRTGSILPRIRRWIATRARVLRELRAANYDAVIDLYPYYPNTAVLMQQAGIPVRAGFASGGGGPAWTTSVPWTEYPVVHISDRQLEVAARVLGPLAPPARYVLPEISSADREAVGQIIDDLRRYVVMHIGAGDRRKMWDESRWIELANELVESGQTVVMTGAGKAEREMARVIQQSVPGIVNAVGQTSLGSLRAVLAGSQCVIANDSLAGHLAAAENVPIVSVMLGPNEPERWRPLAARGVIISAVPGSDEPPLARDVFAAVTTLIGTASHA